MYIWGKGCFFYLQLFINLKLFLYKNFKGKFHEIELILFY